MRKKQVFPILPVLFILMLSLASFAFIDQNPQLLEAHSKLGETAMLQPSSEYFGASGATELLVADGKDTNVLLQVDTANITEETKDEFVFITDDRSESSENSSTPGEHIALVDRNMKIYWSAEALDPQSGVTVDVLGIFRKTEGGSEILEGVFRDPNKDGIVIGKIKNKKVEGLEYYNILIRVNSENPKTFLIDPKLKMID